MLTDIKSGVIRYALVNWLGYSWGKIRLRKINGDPHRPELIRTYCKAYADALQKERDGTHVPLSGFKALHRYEFVGKEGIP